MSIEQTIAWHVNAARVSASINKHINMMLNETKSN